jgi:hypothetical protein
MLIDRTNKQSDYLTERTTMSSKRVTIIGGGIIFILLGLYNNSDPQAMAQTLSILGLRGNVAITVGIIATIGTIMVGITFVVLGLRISEERLNRNTSAKYTPPQHNYVPQSPATPSATSSLEAELANLTNMLNKGVIDQEEYKRLRESLISKS